MASFGGQLRRLRMRAGLGLRTFAELIAERTSTVSAIELGHAPPGIEPTSSNVSPTCWVW